MIVEVKIYYPKNIRLILQGRTFQEAIDLIYNAEPFAKYSPLKMAFTATGEILFMDELAFSKYLAGEITQEDLIRLTECEDIYRNKYSITTPDHYTVDAGKTWKLKKHELSLATHPYITTPLDLEVFELID